MAELTGKEKPNVCFIPTASGDDEGYIKRFQDVCSQLEVHPHVIKVWINSYDQKETFEEQITKMDVIVVGGGNTLNMLAIWKAQGIDVALKKAYEKELSWVVEVPVLYVGPMVALQIPDPLS